MRLVIVTGMGRSGTAFLAELLGRSANTDAYHEYFGDRHFTSLSFYDPEHPLLEHTLRAAHAALAAGTPDNRVVVDVNSWLRYGLGAVHRALDAPPCYHLVRNGRDVVASMYRRKVYTARERSLPLAPRNPTVFELWADYTRFERLCWQWHDAVERLLVQDLPLLRLEDIVRDFDYFETKFLQPNAIDVPVDAWRQLKRRRLNRGRRRAVDLLRGRGRSLDWTNELEASFDAICGGTMRRLGYA